MDERGQTQIPGASEPQILKPSWGFWGLLGAVLVYLWLLGNLMGLAYIGGGLGAFLSVLALLYICGAILLAAAIFAHDRRILKDALIFKRNKPFEGFGLTAVEFQHVFAVKDPNVLREVIELMDREITTNLGWDPYKVMKLTDEDKRLAQRDARSFLVWRGGKTKRGGSVFLVARPSQKGAICSMQWWIVLSGVIDNGAVRVYLAFAPFTLPFWFIPWLRGHRNVAAGLRRVYNSFYEIMDIVTSAKSAQKISFDSLIAVLNKHGIDTSELKLQAFNVINNNQISINNSSNVGLNNVVQGARNLVAPAAGAQGARNG